MSAVSWLLAGTSLALAVALAYVLAALKDMFRWWK